MNHDLKSQSKRLQEPPWYRQFWPWFIIALPASAVLASLITFYLAISRPDPLVVEDDEYRRLNSELKAQQAETEKEPDQSPGPDPKPH